MNKPYLRRPATAVLASLAGAALVCTFAAPAPAADNPAAGAPTTTFPAQAGPAQKIAGDLASRTGQVSVYVQFAGQGAFDATQSPAVKANQTAPVADPGAVAAIRSTIAQTAAAVTTAAAATQLYTTTNSLPGTAITGDAAAIRDLAKRGDVVKITPIVPKKIPENKGTDLDTRAIDTWSQAHYTGKDVVVAVIDSGLDYTHTDFGGPGTQAAFDQATASATMPAGTYDPSKVIPGYDLAGDAYDGTNTPVPDNNPIDCVHGGHGTHVAGTVAGFGVNEDGSTYRAGTTGSPAYTDLTPQKVNTLKIGPGSAPEAKLVSYRVFGCGGSSDLVIPALDRALDPRGDGSFTNKANIINMSLGSDYSPTDDPENDVIDNLTRNGILSVVASGNAGDIYDIGGAPGNARSALTVANSVGSTVGLDRVDVLSTNPVSSVSGQYSGFNFSNPALTPAQLTGTVVMGPAGANADGCAAFSAADAARVKGQWVWLHWEDVDAQRKCGSALRFNNAQAAGATGVVLDSTLNVFSAGIAGNATIPGVQLTGDASAALRPAAVAGTLKIQLKKEYLGVGSAASGRLDQLNSSSSRGVHGSNGIVKPDVSAPGTSIASAGVGSGSGAAIKSGTSMATPHVAGIAALVYQATKRDPLEIKSIVMNTASHNVVTADGKVFGPNRVGSGRVDALDAVSTPSFAYAAEDPILTSVDFGVLEVTDQPVVQTKQVIVKNISDTAASYAVAYQGSTAMPGVTYSVPKSVNVPAHSQSTVNVTATITPSALAKTIDPTMAPEQNGVSRQFLADASGRLVLSGQGLPTLKVPVYAAPKPVAAMTAGSTISFAKKQDTTAPLVLSGRPLAQGTGSEAYVSAGAPFLLQTSSPRLDKLGDAKATDPQAKENGALRAMDLQYVGVNSNIPALAAAAAEAEAAGKHPDKAKLMAEKAMVTFGVSTWGNWAALTSAYQIAVGIDTNGDGKPDYTALTSTLKGIDGVFVSLYTGDKDKGTLSANPIDVEYANTVAGSTDTNVYDTNTIMLPVLASALGIDGTKAAPLSYTVSTYSWYKKDAVDTAAPQSFDPVNPALWFSTKGTDPLLVDAPGTAITVHRDKKDTESKALFLHLHNATGDLSATGNGGTRAQVLTLDVPAHNKKGSVTSSASKVHPGDSITLTGEGFDDGTDLSAELHSAPVPLGNVTTTAAGTFSATVTIPASAPAGQHTIVVTLADGQTVSVPLEVLAPAGTGTPAPGDPGTGNPGAGNPGDPGAGDPGAGTNPGPGAGPGAGAGAGFVNALGETGVPAGLGILLLGGTLLLAAGAALLVLRRRRRAGVSPAEDTTE